MQDIIKKDLYRYRPFPYSFKQLLQGFRSPGFRYTFFMRKVALAKNPIVYWLYKMILRRYLYKYSFQIGANTKIGEGLYIGHFGRVIISVNATIGKYCNLSPGVTIGRDHRGKRRGAPTIGDYVWIGTNTVIVGRVEIGNNVLIAPNSFVNFDVPANSIVIGNPGKIITRDNPTEGYINNTQ